MRKEKLEELLGKTITIEIEGKKIERIIEKVSIALDEVWDAEEGRKPTVKIDIRTNNWETIHTTLNELNGE